MAEKAKFLKGQLLLDSGQLGGSFFQRTVVLVCQHNNDGAFGLVLNRALGKTAGELSVEGVKVHKLAVNGIPRSGHAAELLAHFGIDAAAIVKTVKSL